LICERPKDKLTILKYKLNNRLYLGHATTPEVLAFIMNNFALVNKDKIVLDPFVGSAGILIAASHMKAVCFGCEIDKRILYNKGFNTLIYFK
jgi:tRNA (guanine10-N2)-methyltransferase